ncbi:MAG: hypothetical protein KGJ59_13520 [Bacteroidota bacterium]|nr:hypothetical protein [Bacteroidota bacterium]
MGAKQIIQENFFLHNTKNKGKRILVDFQRQTVDNEKFEISLAFLMFGFYY